MKRLLIAGLVALTGCDIEVPLGETDGGAVILTDGGQVMTVVDGGVPVSDGGGNVVVDAGMTLECVDRFDCPARPNQTATCIVNVCVYSAVDAGATIPPIDAGPTSPNDAGSVDAGNRPPFDAGQLPVFDGGLRIFITRDTFEGDLGGLAGGDEKCQLAAAAAELGGTWVAYLSVGAVTAPSRMTASGPWYQQTAPNTLVKIFNNLAILSTNPLVAFGYDQTGTHWGNGGHFPLWTGTEAGGVTSSNCNGFTSAEYLSYGQAGQTDSTVSSWTEGELRRCSEAAHLICFEQSHLPAAKAVSQAHRRVFMTRSTFSGNLGGLAGADTKCRLAAEAAELGGTWKAFLSDGTVSAPSRMEVEGAWYQGTTGSGLVKLFNNRANLRTDPLIAFGYDETGAHWGNGSRFPLWTGTRSGGAPGFTCKGFTSAEYLQYGVAGQTDSTVSSWVDGEQRRCSYEAHLLCFEQ